MITKVIESKNGVDLSQAIEDEFTLNDEFPVSIFPASLVRLIDDANETIRYNPEFLSAGILSACATAIGNKVKLHNGSYESKAILWVSIIGNQGIGKTHPLRFVKQPIEAKDRENYNEFQQLFQQYESQENKGSKPNYIKTILSDFTSEKLAETLQFNDNGVLIFKDELMGWINSFDQYRKGGDQQKYLELFNGASLSVDRVSKPPIRVEETNVNVLGGIQPKKLKGMGSNDRLDDGFMSRFLYVYPKISEPNLFTGKSISEENIENYQRLIFNLFDLDEKTLVLSENQMEIYKEWQHKMAYSTFKDEVETAIQSKLETYVFRLILVLEMINQASNGCYSNGVEDESVYNALRLIEYFRFNALKVFDRINNENPLEDLPLNKLELYKELPIEFVRKEVINVFNQFGVSESSMDRFLRNKSLFTRANSKGGYKKVYM